MQHSKLHFGKGNAKLDVSIATFSLPAGKTCPGAKGCHSYVVKHNGKRHIVDGPETSFRCYAASQEVLFGNVHDSRTTNLKILRAALKIGERHAADVINASLPSSQFIRVHVSGDFFSSEYFRAWMLVAAANPTKTFYAYTKSIKVWLRNKHKVPANFILTASLGGRWDHLVAKYNLRSARVVFSEQEAKSLGLAIDHDDSLAMSHGPSFALLLHGIQPLGSEASKARAILLSKGQGGYRRLPVRIG